MKIKKYIAESMGEAIRQIKQELGGEAIIISSRQISQQGMMGFLKPKLWEVTAALDSPKEPAPAEVMTVEENTGDLRSEIAEIKNLIKMFSHEKIMPSQEEYEQIISRWGEVLTEAGISEELTGLIIKKIDYAPNWKRDEVDHIILNEIKLIMEEMIDHVYRQSSFKKVHAFIGSTGVGKTTTIAKIAARQALFNDKKVGIITIDTFRIGAVEQLKTYGDIIGAPVEVVSSPAQLAAAIQQFQDMDLIMIDTAGRSYRNTMQLGILKSYLDRLPDAEVYLVLSATTKESDLAKNIENYGKVGFSRLIFTKIDETSSLGSIFNTAVTTNVPVEYITNGQNVPDDIEIMGPGKLTGLVLGGDIDAGSSSKAKRPGSSTI